jgi:ferrous iron transport protein A
MNKNKMLTLDKLLVGEEAIIMSFTNNAVKLILLEMGCIPGEKISIERIAPLGDPIAINVSGYLLSMRKAEASAVEVKKV